MNFTLIGQTNKFAYIERTFYILNNRFAPKTCIFVHFLKNIYFYYYYYSAVKIVK